MKDYVTARERLSSPWKLRINDFLWTMLSLGLAILCVYELLREVNYVN